MMGNTRAFKIWLFCTEPTQMCVYNYIIQWFGSAIPKGRNKPFSMKNDLDPQDLVTLITIINAVINILCHPRIFFKGLVDYVVELSIMNFFNS